ncbi:hypothetical protein BU070_10100, partial [Mammaliicoccus vitulinus]
SAKSSRLSTLKFFFIFNDNFINIHLNKIIANFLKLYILKQSKLYIIKLSFPYVARLIKQAT